MKTTDKILKVNQDVTLQKIAGEHFLIPTENSMLKYNGLIQVNELETELWELLAQGASIDKLVHTMMLIYDVQEYALREDIREFLDKLSDMGILTEMNRDE